ncbi:hypothetical protein HW532_08440 [Kaustia mangrovi]|uniref:DNA methylase n=1 Tax=Kaustia mangrovi TaxID=2593653 RepID=A0A7S8C3L0_9HYPH|nr:hypothetical protein [Kaustia mangrovi]QPC42722.1 hypothetical protein HW532_08440 [Kaustia mangrovi]
MTGVSTKISLLDACALPIEQLARIAMKEGVRPRAEYQAHKWFARRLAVTARGLLAGFGTRDGENFWKTFYSGTGFEDLRVLDPFCGGGVMLLEAQRLGAHAIGFDVEPVAAAISAFQAELGALPDLSKALEELRLSVLGEIGEYYRTRSQDGVDETLLHAFWVQIVTCGECGAGFDAHPRFRLARTEAAKRQWVACSSCSRLIEADSDAVQVTCPCGAATDPSGAHQRYGAAVCPNCGHSEPLIDIARREGKPEFRLFAVESLPSGDERVTPMAERSLRSATAYDVNLFKKAESALASRLASKTGLLPRSPIPKTDRADDRLLSYGYVDYTELFNARQKLHLVALSEAIDALPSDLRGAFSVAFSDHLKTNNMMCAYAGDWRRLTPLFSIRAYRHISRPVELNPWLNRNGRGTFPNAIRSVQRAGTAFKEHRVASSVLYDEPMAYHTGRSEIACRDSKSMPAVADGSIDLVLTDPPYLDYIAYSELGHFFAPWMHRFGLIDGNSIDRFPSGQLAAPANTKDHAERFIRHLGQIFEELRRKMKPEGRFVFTYQNLDGRGWKAIGRALARAGFQPVSVFPLYGENGSRLHKRGNSISWDCVVVCKKADPVRNFRTTKDDRRQGASFALSWQKRLEAAELPFGKGDLVNLTLAGEILFALSRRQGGKLQGCFVHEEDRFGSVCACGASLTNEG